MDGTSREEARTVPGRAADATATDTASSRYRLAFYIPNLSMGGAEQVTASIVNGLAERGHDVELLLSHLSGELQSEIHPDVSVVALGTARIPVAGIGAHVYAIARYIRRTEPDVMFPQMLHAGVVCLAAGLLVDAGTKIVPTAHCTLRGRSPDGLKSRLTRAIAPRLYPTADHVVAVSEGVAEDVVETLSVRPEDVSVLNNPVRVDAVRARAAESVDHRWLGDDDLDVVLFVGRHERQKDLDTWLRAFERVYRDRPRARGILAGRGSRREELRRTADDLGLTDAVSFPGYVDNPYGYMAAADAFLLTSRYEGLPTVLIEALACGCPVVATDCPSGPREILADGEYGRLAEVGDSAALAAAVRATLADPPSVIRLRERADRYAPEQVLDEYERFIGAQVGR
jgi:glycosyltransferase involved in cell wall biosynthesis